MFPEQNDMKIFLLKVNANVIVNLGFNFNKQDVFNKVKQYNILFPAYPTYPDTSSIDSKQYDLQWQTSYKLLVVSAFE
jgi:hypothetical protein